MLVDGQIAEFVDDEQSRLEIFVQFAFQIAMGVSRAERVDDIDRRGKEYRVAAQTGAVPKGDTQMAFTQADVGNEDHVGLFLDKAQAEQVLDLWPVDLLRPAPVELIEGLEHRKAGESDPSLDTAVFAPVGLALDESRQIVDMRPLFGSGFLDQRFKVLEHIRQLETRQVRAQGFGDGWDARSRQSVRGHRHGPRKVRDPVARSGYPGDPGGG